MLEIVFGSITYSKDKLAYKRALDFDRFKESLAKKVDEIPAVNRIEPSESIIGPALEAAKYRIGTEKLREIFSSLISASLDSEKVASVHPLCGDNKKSVSAGCGSSEAPSIHKRQPYCSDYFYRRGSYEHT